LPIRIQRLSELEVDALARYTALLAAIGGVPLTPELEADAAKRFAALSALVAAIPTTPELEADAAKRFAALSAAVAAIPTTPELEVDALKRYTALAAALAAIPIGTLLSADFNKTEFETEWSSDPVVENVASAAATNLTTHEISAANFVYPTGAVERRVILLPMIKAAAQAAATHHIGLKVQRNINDGGWADLKDYTANPPLVLAADGAPDSWGYPIDIAALVASGSKLQFRFVVDSDNANSVNYTTSFLVVLVYRMG